MAIGVGAARGADQLLDAGIDVGAVERGDARLGRGEEIVNRGIPIDPAMAAGQLPAAADHPGDAVAGTKRAIFHHSFLLGQGHGRGVGVIEPALAEPRDLEPGRAMGSGHATSASVLIQSLVSLGRCFAARSGKSAPSE